MVDFELPGMENLPRLPPKPKAQYRQTVDFDVAYEDYVFFDTDDDPRNMAENEAWADAVVNDTLMDGDSTVGWVHWGPIEASYDGGKTWEDWDERAWEADREESPDW